MCACIRPFRIILKFRSPLLNFITHYSQSNLAATSKLVNPSFRLVSSWPDRIAITDQYGDYSYRNLLNSSKILADQVTKELNGKVQERVAFLCPNNASHVLMQWACWISGQITVPLNHQHPDEMLKYFLTDSDASILLTTTEYEDKCRTLCENTGVKIIILDDEIRNDALIVNQEKNYRQMSSLKAGLNPNLYSKVNALIIYTSGSTAMPKGVVISHANLQAQTSSMIKAWKWSCEDTILHALPLNHIHGIVNALLTPLYCGARCLMLPKFDAKKVWNHLLAVKIGNSQRVTVFTGVPTMYIKLIEEYENSLSKSNRLTSYVKASCFQKIRLMMSGSAPLPEPVFEKWEEITGHRLLERYGMSEIGMALSNPIDGLRRPGFIGNPMPGVQVRISDKDKVLVEGSERGSKILNKDDLIPKETQYSGELQVKGDTVFVEYWRKPEVTANEFTADGWFKTGDTVQFIDNGYKILGRSSVDIIKSGGYKISALFIETVLIQHPMIKDVIVVGVKDSTWGQRVAAVVVPVEVNTISLLSLKEWAKDKLPSYCIPMEIRIVPEIPRNLMGKVNKKELLKNMFK